MTTIVLDPTEVATDRVQLAITPWVGSGVDWGDAAIEQYLAENTIGSTPVDFKVPNRTVTIPLVLQSSGGTPFATIRSQIQHKAAIFQREGGWIKRTSGQGDVFADVVGATLSLGGHGFMEDVRLADLAAELVLECLPDWYGPEISLAQHDTSIDGSFVLGGSYFDAVMAADPDLYWRLGAGGGTDSSGNGRTGTAAGGVTIGGAAGLLRNDANAATDFDGIDDRITSSFSPFTNGSAWTFMGIANRDGTTTDALFGSSSATATTWVRFAVDSTANVTFTVNGAVDTHIWTGVWEVGTPGTHWALTFDEPNNVAELFLNGVSKGIKTVAQAYSGSAGTFQVGARSGSSDPFDGRIDEVAILPGRRTAAEIRTYAMLARADAAVKGNYPARARMVVSSPTANECGLIWGMRSRNFSQAGETTAIVYEAEDLTLLDASDVVAQAGSYGSDPADNNAVRLTGMPPRTWTPMLSTQIAATGEDMQHVGNYRVWVRALSNSTPRLRFVWDSGDFATPRTNRPADVGAALSLVAPPNYFMVDLGEIQLAPAPIGTHRWRGVIQAYGVNGIAANNTVTIDRIWFVPIDDGYGTLRIGEFDASGLTTLWLRDGFNQASGPLTGKVAPVGGTWVFSAGDTDDFGVLSVYGGAATRGVASDTARRFNTLPTNRAGLWAQVDFQHETQHVSLGVESILLTRFVGSTNYLYTGLFANVGQAPLFCLQTVEVGAFLGPTVAVPFAIGVWYTMRVQVDTDGRALAWMWVRGSEPTSEPTLRWWAVALATGGSLDDGLIGIGDYQTGSPAVGRVYDNLMAGPLIEDAVVFTSRSLEMRSDGMFREDAAGGFYSPVPLVTGKLPRIPPGGPEGQAVEVFVRANRGDLGIKAEVSLDRCALRVHYNPCWLFVPEA